MRRRVIVAQVDAGRRLPPGRRSLGPLPVGVVRWPGNHRVTVVVKATYEYDFTLDEQTVKLAAVQRPIAGDSDFALYKPTVDVLVAGHAYAETARRAIAARVAVAAVDRRFTTVGGRLERMPLTPEFVRDANGEATEPVGPCGPFASKPPDDDDDVDRYIQEQIARKKAELAARHSDAGDGAADGDGFVADVVVAGGAAAGDRLAADDDVVGDDMAVDGETGDDVAADDETGDDETTEDDELEDVALDEDVELEWAHLDDAGAPDASLGVNFATLSQRSVRIDNDAEILLEGLVPGGEPCRLELGGHVPRISAETFAARFWVDMELDTVLVDTDEERIEVVWRGQVPSSADSIERLVVSLEPDDDELRPLIDVYRDLQRGHFFFAAEAEPPEPDAAGEILLQAARYSTWDLTPNPSVSLEDYIAVAAQLSAQPTSRGEVLQQHGFDEDGWLLEERAWLERVADASSNGDDAFVDKYGYLLQQAISRAGESA